MPACLDERASESIDLLTCFLFFPFSLFPHCHFPTHSSPFQSSSNQRQKTNDLNDITQIIIPSITKRSEPENNIIEPVERKAAVMSAFFSLVFGLGISFCVLVVSSSTLILRSGERFLRAPGVCGGLTGSRNKCRWELLVVSCHGLEYE
jgi:hypothetical protein